MDTYTVLIIVVVKIQSVLMRSNLSYRIALKNSGDGIAVT